jgi:hypothetical protein
MSTNQLLPSFLPSALIGAAIGFVAGMLVQASLTCPAPPNATQVKTNDGSVRIHWDASPKAQAYLVWARDSTVLNTDSVTSSITVTGNETVLHGLQPNHGYLVEVFGICKDGTNKFSFSKIPVDIGVRTGWIVVEDIVEFGAPKCPYDVCDTLVTKTDTCFNWGPGEEFYSFDIRKRGVNGAPDVLVSHFYMQKTEAKNTLKVQVFGNSPCGIPTLNPPSTKNCGKGQPAFRLCGTASAPNVPPVDYSVQVDFANCCINGLPESQYLITISKCHYNVATNLRTGSTTK